MILIGRLRILAVALLVAIDQLGGVLIFGAVYLVRGGSMPNPDETISSRVGRASLGGSRIARVAEWLIDALFRLIANQPDHCRSEIEWDEVQ